MYLFIYLIAFYSFYNNKKNNCLYTYIKIGEFWPKKIDFDWKRVKDSYIFHKNN